MKMLNLQSKKMKNGRWKEFNKRGILIAEGSFVNNKKHGLWKEYYDHTGSIMIEEVYDHGTPHGRYAAFHPNGQLLSEGNFLMGLREGYFKIYDEYGNNTHSLFFDNDIQIENTFKLERAEERGELQNARY